jgi:hypothetical protein
MVFVKKLGEVKSETTRPGIALTPISKTGKAAASQPPVPQAAAFQPQSHRNPELLLLQKVCFA